MARIKVSSPEEATGLLKQEYDVAAKRAVEFRHIVSIMSQNAETMKASMGLYRVLMFWHLSRAQREMLATVVSALNHCLY